VSQGRSHSHSVPGISAFDVEKLAALDKENKKIEAGENKIAKATSLAKESTSRLQMSKMIKNVVKQRFSSLQEEEHYIEKIYHRQLRLHFTLIDRVGIRGCWHHFLLRVCVVYFIYMLFIEQFWSEIRKFKWELEDFAEGAGGGILRFSMNKRIWN
jgi:hypothetical protein